jgi:hypothetical protein
MFNSLNTLAWLPGKSYEIYVKITRLSEIRYSLTQKWNHTIALEEEIEMVENFNAIRKKTKRSDFYKFLFWEVRREFFFLSDTNSVHDDMEKHGEFRQLKHGGILFVEN